MTVNQIIIGSHYNRPVTAHEITLHALFDLWMESFFHENPQVQHAINSGLEKVKDAFKLSDDTNKQGAIQKAFRDLLVNIASMNLLKQLIDF